MATEEFAGPVALVVFEFPPGAAVDAGLSALLTAVDAGLVEVLDLEVIGKDEAERPQRLDWSVALSEASRAAFVGAESDILDEEDLAVIAASLPSGHVAIAIVYEDRSLASAAAAWTQGGGVELFVGGVDVNEMERLLGGEGDR